MKKAMNTTKMITIGFFTICIMSLSSNVFAGPKTDTPVEIKFIGNIKSQPVFQLNLNNEETAEYYITIKNKADEIIYTEKVRGANLARKYQVAIDHEELNYMDFGLTFEVTSAKSNKTKVYKISSKPQITETFEVAKL